jgi:CRP-like cAMP-binding protein
MLFRDHAERLTAFHLGSHYGTAKHGRPTNAIDAKNPLQTGFLVAESRLLNSLSPHISEQVLQGSERVHFKRGELLLTAREPARFVFFPLDCMVSMVVSLENGNTVEAATVGNDGFVGISSFLGMEQTDITAVVQLPGEALRLPVDAFRKLLNDDAFRTALGAFAAKTVATIAQSTACNTFHPVHERLARWLLLVRDSTERNEFALTQEFIAVMLGVHRPTVTIAMRLLEAARLIQHRRGLIRIVDAGALADAACECYRLSSWNRYKA